MFRKILIVLLAVLMVMPLSLVAGATGTSVTSPLEDLQACEGFNQANYPAIEGSGKLEVLHLAETVDDQVLLYVYAPGNAVAAHATISLTDEGKEVDFNEYALTLTASDGVFQKYIVNGIKVDAAKVVRNYEVASILRPFDEALGDKAPADDNIIHEVAYEVGLMWTYNSNNGDYLVNQRSVITVTKKHVGFIRYEESSMIICKESIDSHYVAFRTDKKIDNLLSVDIIYTGEKKYASNSLGAVPDDVSDYGPFGPIEVTLTSDQVFKKDSLFWGFEYERIQTIDEFQQAETLTVATKKALQDMEWVLRFAETDHYKQTNLLGKWFLDYTSITDVLLLRMEFETDGITYNMGVVDDKTRGDDVPDGPKDLDWLYIVILVVALVIIISLANVLVPVLKFIGWLVLIPLKLLWWLLKAIGKGIAALFKKS